MSKLSPKMRFVGGAGLGLVVLLAGFKLLVHSGPPAPIPIPVPVHHLVKPHATAAKTVTSATQARHRARPARPKVYLVPGLPAPLRRALTESPIVIAVLYAPGVLGDSDAVDAAQQGAKAAHAGFAALNVRDEAVARAVAKQVAGIADPSVLVVRRPGTIALKLDGYADSAVVAQAAANARP